MILCILGRQPALGLAELEAQYSGANVTPVGSTAALVETDELTFDRLGSVVKAAEVLTTLPTTNPQKALLACRRLLPDYVANTPEGKIKLAVSLYDLSLPLHKLTANVLSLKSALKHAGRSVRAVPNTAPALSSAQTYHNHLTSPLGCELILVPHHDGIIVARVTHVQDITSYTLRDRGRPKRDAFVGMLPPKLAQIMVNLAGPLPLTTATPPRILDPFCGTGVVLQEAGLMGYAVYGTDHAEKMIRYSRDNLEWLARTHHLTLDTHLHEANAMDATWQAPIDAVVCEAYLGQPFSAPPSPAKLREVVDTCDHIISTFLRNIAPQLAPGTPLCVAVPAWRDTDGSFTHLPLIGRLGTLGYHVRGLRTVRPEALLYYRDDQVVARELLVLNKA